MLTKQEIDTELQELKLRIKDFTKFLKNSIPDKNYIKSAMFLAELIQVEAKHRLYTDMQLAVKEGFAELLMKGHIGTVIDRALDNNSANVVVYNEYKALVQFVKEMGF